MKNPWDIVSGFKHDSRLKCHRGIVSQRTFQVGLNVTVDETWVDVTSRHLLPRPVHKTMIVVFNTDMIARMFWYNGTTVLSSTLNLSYAAMV